MSVGWRGKVGIMVPYNPAKVGLALRQPNQQERTKNAHSPQFKHIGGGGWVGSRKSSLAAIRLSPDYTVFSLGVLGIIL